MTAREHIRAAIELLERQWGPTGAYPATEPLAIAYGAITMLNKLPGVTEVNDEPNS